MANKATRAERERLRKKVGAAGHVLCIRCGKSAYYQFTAKNGIHVYRCPGCKRYIERRKVA